jgi:Cell wall-active antibiotics response LiaF, C-terminal
VQMQEYRPAPEARVPDAVGATTMADPPPPTTAAPVPRPVHEHPAGLGRIVLPLIVLAIGVLGMIDLAGADVAASAYVAVPLAIVGFGLVVRAWYGRGWSLAVIGAVLALALVIVTAAERADVVATNASTWRPLTIDQVDARYAANVGDALLDLSAVDFVGQSKDVQVNLDAGNLTIVVPAKVDVQADVRVNVGNAVVFGQSWGGIGQSSHAVTDLGSDGAGGGDLTIHASVNVGNVEVHR